MKFLAKHFFSIVPLMAMVFVVGLFGLCPQSANASYTPGAFVTTWKTDNPGTSNGDQITIPTIVGLTYNYDVDWGDSTSSVGVTGDITHTYSTPGTYEVEITGTFPAIHFGMGGDAEKLLSVNQWGDNVWATMNYAFAGCTNMQILANDTPDLSSVIDMTYMLRATGITSEDLSLWDVGNVQLMIGLFQDTAFNGDITTWDVANVTNMTGLFYANASFNQNIGGWSTLNVGSMSGMFQGATSFDRDLSGWDVGLVTDMSSMFEGATSFNSPLLWGGQTSAVNDMHRMFYGATSFNQDIGGWGTTSVTNMNSMFAQATVFNQDISGWDTGNVTDMSMMFNATDSFNQPLDNWDVSSVTGMGGMFYEANAFNQPLNSWDVSHVTSMGAMFMGAELFNQPLDNWDVSSVVYMGNTFQGSGFNQDINNWDMSSVTDIYAMFAHNPNFNKNMSSWDTSNITNMNSAFYAATAFDQDLSSWDVSKVTDMIDMFAVAGLSTANYDALLAGWSAQSLRPDVVFSAGDSKYCSSVAERTHMIDADGWTITDAGPDGEDCPPAQTATTGTSVSAGIAYICTDPKALNYQSSFGISSPSACSYGEKSQPVVSPIFSRTLKPGMNGDDIKALQIYLNTHGYPVTPLGKETKLFGPKTKRSVQAFQKAHGLKADGVVGPKTREVMK